MRDDATIKPFLVREMSRRIAAKWGTPAFVYCEDLLRQAGERAKNIYPVDGVTVRYAMKANPVRAILRLFGSMGLWIDASSGNEVRRAMKAGIEAGRILLTAQELPDDLSGLVSSGMEFNACSLHQLKVFAAAFPGADVGLRINPGFGKGHSRRTTVGGPFAPFGIWHEELGVAREMAASASLRIRRLHMHVGSGSDAITTHRASKFAMELLLRFPEADVLNMGGGFSVDRMTGEQDNGIRQAVRRYIADLSAFRRSTGRHVRLEIEPGTYLVANAGILLTTVKDIKRAGRRRFIVIDSGMTELLRPMLYAARHPVWIQQSDAAREGAADYAVVGHCCESGDIITTGRRSGSVSAARRLPKTAIGDLLLVGGAGAYGATMSAAGYCSFLRAAEVMVGLDGNPELIRRRETLEQLMQNEI